MIVTISNQYGAGAWGVARRAAEALGYEYVNRQLPVVVAQRLQIPVEEAEADDSITRSAGEQFLTALERATPELAEMSTTPDFDETLVRAVADAIREYAAQGDKVIVGRGGGAVLGRRPDVVRVFLYAPLEYRVQRIAGHYGVDAKSAQREIERIDKARAAYMREWYGVAFGDPENYELCLDTSALGEAQCAATIVEAVRTRA